MYYLREPSHWLDVHAWLARARVAGRFGVGNGAWLLAGSRAGGRENCMVEYFVSMAHMPHVRGLR